MAALRRTPDLLGLKYWTKMIDNSSVPLVDVANDFASSPEFIHNNSPLSDSGFVEQLYRNVLGRPGDAAGAQYWNTALAAGVGRGRVLVDFAESQENKANTISTSGDIHNAEAYRLYGAALNRTPDVAGLNYWSEQLGAGNSPTHVAQELMNSPEFQQKYGALGAGDFVSIMYQNTIHRSADASGSQYWANALQQGSSKASVLVSFSDSLENREQTAGATHANWVFVPS
jgi:hypothetical protein